MDHEECVDELLLHAAHEILVRVSRPAEGRLAVSTCHCRGFSDWYTGSTATSRTTLSTSTENGESLSWWKPIMPSDTVCARSW